MSANYYRGVARSRVAAAMRVAPDWAALGLDLARAYPFSTRAGAPWKAWTEAVSDAMSLGEFAPRDAARRYVQGGAR